MLPHNNVRLYGVLFSGHDMFFPDYILYLFSFALGKMWLTSFASARVVFVQVMRQCVPASAHSDHNVTPQYLYKDDNMLCTHAE